MSTLIRIFLSLPLFAILAACGSDPVQTRASVATPELVAPNDPAAFAAIADQSDVLFLAREIVALSSGVDPQEAVRAAVISYAHTAELKAQYQITDPPLLHNYKVNRGIKPRGLCWHWAEDMEKRLKAENFQTLDLHRAIANHDNVRIDHSTAIISAKGDTLFNGVVIDPWRKGGTLTWMKVEADERYNWRPQAEVLAYYKARDGL